MSSWSFLHVGAEIIRTDTLEVASSVRELAANGILPTLWLALFERYDLEVFDVTDEEEARELADSGLLAEGERDLEVFWLTRLDLARVRAERLWAAVRSDTYYWTLWRPLELLLDVLKTGPGSAQVLLDPREFIATIGQADFLDPARALVDLFTRARTRGLAGVTDELATIALSNPSLFALGFTGDAERDVRLAHDLLPLFRLDSAARAVVWATVGWPSHDAALGADWEGWLAATDFLPTDTVGETGAGPRSPSEEAAAFLAFLSEHGLIEYSRGPRGLLTRVGTLLASDRDDPGVAGTIHELLMADEAVEEVFCDVDTLRKAVDVWG